MMHKPAFAAAVLAAGLLVAAPMPALAHDEVVSTTPSADSSVEAGVQDVIVAFNEDIMATPHNSGEVIEVDGPDGTVWSNGCVQVAGGAMRTQVDLDAPGTYTVNWRSVSNDGHPNEGSFNFTLTNTTDYHSGGLIEPSAECASAMPTETPLAVAYDDKMAQTSTVGGTTPDPFISNLPYLIAGLVLILLGALAGPLVQRIKAKNAARRAALKGKSEED